MSHEWMQHGRSMLFAAALGVAMAPLGAAADQHEGEQASAAQEPAAEQHAGMHGDTAGDQAAADRKHREALREKTVSARELMGADVNNLGNPVGDVRDLVLNEDGTAVEYILYEVPYPYSFYGSEDGFVAFENAVVESDAAIGTTVRFGDPASPQAPDRLTLSKAEADHRLLSRILGDTVSFEGDQSRAVEDVLIDRETGQITHYVVNMNPDSWFNDQPHALAADQVTIEDDGNVTTSAEFAALEPIE